MAVNTIPAVFAFDDNFALPAWVAVKSLTVHAEQGAVYDIYIVYSRLSGETISRFKALETDNAKINFIKVDNERFSNAPKSQAWPYEVYYRLIIPELLPQYDKVIYSDVDVMFKGGLAELYGQNLDGYECGAVAAERKDEKGGIHQHFKEYCNDYIFMSGFMVLNTKKMREEKTVEKFFENMRKFEKSLKMFDLEVFNLSCSKIKPVGFEYCVLENLYYGDYKNTTEYRFLKNVYSDAELEAAIAAPKIIHYAGGKVKMWKKINPAAEYYNYIKQSPYAEEFEKQRRFKKIVRLFNPLWYVLSKIAPAKKYRRKMKNICRGNY